MGGSGPDPYPFGVDLILVEGYGSDDSGAWGKESGGGLTRVKVRRHCSLAVVVREREGRTAEPFRVLLRSDRQQGDGSMEQSSAIGKALRVEHSSSKEREWRALEVCFELRVAGPFYSGLNGQDRRWLALADGDRRPIAIMAWDPCQEGAGYGRFHGGRSRRPFALAMAP
jgi:hypothetical protein